MKGTLKDAPNWATHYVERKSSGYFWFINFDDYRWTVYDEPEKEYKGCCARDFVEEDIKNNPQSYLVIELNFSLENE